MKPIFASHPDRRVLEAELFADHENEREDVRRVGPEADSPPPPSPSLRYRPFERLAARVKSN